MTILVEKRNLRSEYELDKIKKKKKNHVLTHNILNNKINYIAYILKTEHRSTINDINYENSNSLQTCFYYCKSYVTFLLLFFPYLHKYIPGLRSSKLRIYRNFYKYILKIPNNFESLLLKLRIIQESKINQVQNKKEQEEEVTQNKTENTIENFTNKQEIQPHLLLQNVCFSDYFSKNSFIQILFSRIYVQKYHKRIFRILNLLLFYFSFPSFSFSKDFFLWYHKKAWTHEEESDEPTKKIKPEKEEVSLKRMYFRTPFFKHVNIPNIYLFDYNNETKELLKTNLVKLQNEKRRGVHKKRNKKKKEDDNTADQIERESISAFSDGSSVVHSDQSLSHLSDSEEEMKVEEFLKKEEKHSEREYYKNDLNDKSENLTERKQFYKCINQWKQKEKTLQEIQHEYSCYVMTDLLLSIGNINKKHKDTNNEYVTDIWKNALNFDDADFNKNSLMHKVCLVANPNLIFLLLHLNVNLITYNEKNELPLHCTLYNCDQYIFLLVLHNTVEQMFFILLTNEQTILNKEMNNVEGEKEKEKDTWKREKYHSEESYIKNDFFYEESINHIFLSYVVKLYISVIIKIIELGNFEFVKILSNYNKDIFMYIIKNMDVFTFLCFVAEMYNALNAFLQICNEALVSHNRFYEERKPHKRKMKQLEQQENEGAEFKKIKREINLNDRNEWDISKEIEKPSTAICKQEKYTISNNTTITTTVMKNIRKKMNGKNKLEIFYSSECVKHVFTPEPMDCPYIRKQIKNNIPENSTRLDVLLSNKHGILHIDTFSEFSIKKINRKVTVADILRVHDLSYLKKLLYKMKKYRIDECLNDNFLIGTKQIKRNYLLLNQVKENEQNDAHTDKERMLEEKQNEKSEMNPANIQKKVEMNEIPNNHFIQNTSKNFIREERLGSDMKVNKKITHIPDRLVLLDNDTCVNKHSFNCALSASGVVLNAIDYVHSLLEKRKKGNTGRKKIFCVVRPPGHHLGTFGAAQFNSIDEDKAAGSQGFCLLNNVAIGAAYAKYQYNRFEKIAIIDFDVHHGNGTEQIIRNLGCKKIRVHDYIKLFNWKGWKNEHDRKNVFFSSIHAYDGFFYPGTGKDTVELEPYIINVTLEKNVTPKYFLYLFINNILIHLFYFKPDILFLSAGFDGHKLDYMNSGFVKNTTSTYFYLTELILSIQNKLNFPIISVLEGGYNTTWDMSSVFSLSVLEHALSCYQNDLTFVNEHVHEKKKMTKKVKTKKRKKKKKQSGKLKFPFVTLDRKKIAAMYEKYFLTFKEKTNETENLHLDKKYEQYQKIMNQLDNKLKRVLRKATHFVEKYKIMLDSISCENNYFNNIKEMELPYHCYFYEILDYFKIDIVKNTKEKQIKERENQNQKEGTEFFSVLNNPSEFITTQAKYFQEFPKKTFAFQQLWKEKE